MKNVKMNKSTLKLVTLALALSLILSLCACGASSRSIVSTESYNYAAAEAATADVYEMGDEAYSYDVNGFSGSGSTMSSASRSGDSATAEDAPETDPQKIIYSADVTLEATDYDAAIAGVQALVDETGGYIQSSSSNSSTYYAIANGYRGTRSTYYTLRIPSSRFEDVMNSFSTLGNVPYSSVYTENVTSQYYDVQARLNAYETQEQSLLALMEKAETVDDIITIQAQLTEVRYTIESLQTTLNSWDRQVSYSTINLSVEEVGTYTPTAQQSFGEKLVQALKSGWDDVTRFVKAFILWLAEALPGLMILAVIIAATVVLIRRARHKKAARKAQKNDAAAEALTQVEGEPVGTEPAEKAAEEKMQK